MIRGNISKFTPRNPEKYLGDPDNITCRSSWELDVYSFCDSNQRIIGWSSEEIKIPYMKPYFEQGNFKTRTAIYYPDLYVEYVDMMGELHKELIEIKPEKYTKASKSKNYATNMMENITYMVNQAKWNAAKTWCTLHGVEFKLFTEKELNIKHTK